MLGHEEFVRAADGVRLPGPRQLFLAAHDLGRDADGAWRVLGDRTQAPSGLGYAMENRRVVSRVVPDLYRDARCMRLAPFFRTLRSRCRPSRPQASRDTPRVVLLTPGTHSETAFDQAFLASLLGFPLVEGSDLTVRDGRVWLRALGRLEPVDVILRRVDAAGATRWSCGRTRSSACPGCSRRRGAARCPSSTPSAAACWRTRGCCRSCPALAETLLGADAAAARGRHLVVRRRRSLVSTCWRTSTGWCCGRCRAARAGAASASC